MEGKCNENIHHDESKWQWVDCDKPFDDVTFEDLWFAVRGGGGGVWGVVLSSIHQLDTLLWTIDLGDMARKNVFLFC